MKKVHELFMRFYGGGRIKSVQQQALDKSHFGQGHWHSKNTPSYW